MQDDTRATAIRAYLVGLYGENPNGLLWIGGHADGWRGRTFAQVDDAVAYALDLDSQGGIGVYHRSTTLANIPKKRGDADDSREVRYFALDVDVAGPGHKAENLPPDLIGVMDLIGAAGFPVPSAWVSSGGGYYPQWRFAEPIDVSEPETRAWVQECFAQIAAHFIVVAKGFGWHLDNVRDLARVFRLPATTNRKVPDAPVLAELMRGEGETYDLGILASLARPNRGQVHEAPVPDRAGSALPQPQDHDDLFDESERTFTRAQAVAFVKEAGAKLGRTEAGLNAAINNFAMACAHFPWLVGQERCAQLMMKYLGTAQGWAAPDRDDLATIASAYKATADGKSWVAVEVQGGTEAGVVPAEGGGPHLPPPGDPMKVARHLLEARERPLRWHQGAYFEHRGRHWAEISDDMIRRWIYRATEDATYTAINAKGEPDTRRWSPNAAKVNHVHDALSRGIVQTEDEPAAVMALENGVLEPVTRTLTDHSPDRFNLSSLPFAYDPEATCPQWLDFLESTLPGDRQAHETLAEWFGYVLSGRTDLHKIGVLVGPPRCGKGTISRILKAMIGQEAWAAPTLARFAGEFGMASLIGKSVAVMGDVRWTSKYVIDAVPIMLGISGEDSFSISRKYMTDWIGKLDTRLMLMSNDAPVFTDASGALAGRMVYVAFHRSFMGHEDLTLEGRLMTELPGILNWALDGLDRVTAAGAFTQSIASLELRDEVDRDSSPVKAWVDDRCVIDLTSTVSLEALLSSYRDWLVAENIQLSPSSNRLSRELRSAFGDQGVVIERKSNGVGGKHRVVTGIRVLAGGSIASDDLFDSH